MRLSFFAERKKESGYFFQIKRKREGTGYHSSSSDRRSQHTERDSGAFQPRCFTEKKEAQHQEGRKKKTVSHKSHTPRSPPLP